MNPQQLNRFAYVRNNPLIHTDPTGHFIPEIGRGNHNTEDDLHKDIVNRMKDGRGFDEDKGKRQTYKSYLEDMTFYFWARSELEGIPRRGYPPPWTLQIGLTFTYGFYRAAVNKALGLITGYSYKNGMQIGVYAMEGIGTIIGKTADAGLEVIVSGNDDIHDIGGAGKTAGVSASINKLAKAALGVEVNEPFSEDCEPSYSLNLTGGIGSYGESHALGTAAAVLRIF